MFVLSPFNGIESRPSSSANLVLPAPISSRPGYWLYRLIDGGPAFLMEGNLAAGRLIDGGVIPELRLEIVPITSSVCVPISRVAVLTSMKRLATIVITVKIEPAMLSPNAQVLAVSSLFARATVLATVAPTSRARLVAPMANASVNPTGGRSIKLTTTNTAPRATPSHDRQSLFGLGAGLGGM